MTDYNTLITLLKELAMDMTDCSGCAGCVHEHNCRTEGCAILRDAIATIEQLYKDVSGRCECCTAADVPAHEEPCLSCHLCYGSLGNWQWRGVQKEDEDNG
ncbi:MAG: hypothetical protein LUC30_01175 [Clostridiales bacterium]|nr:hypothetical protein [Clostridiales bacterium]